MSSAAACPPREPQAGIIRFLYGTVPGRLVLPLLIRPGFSRLAGKFLDSPCSRFLIRPFVQKNRISMEGYAPISSFPSFNSFFTREIRPGYRPIDPDPARLIAPCDGKLTALRLTGDARFVIKGVSYTAGALLRDSALAERFRDGWLLIFRLTVDDYHRYCYPVDGIQGVRTAIPGVLHTVNPFAAGKRPIYRENAREYVVLRTRAGAVLQMEVGALLVGKITNFHGPGRVRRGKEKGMFQFGGSTIVLMLENNRLLPEPRVLENSARGIETVVRMGEHIGSLIEAPQS